MLSDNVRGGFLKRFYKNHVHLYISGMGVLQMVVNYLMCVPETKLGSSARSMCALNHGAISPIPKKQLFYHKQIRKLERRH